MPASRHAETPTVRTLPTRPAGLHRGPAASGCRRGGPHRARHPMPGSLLRRRHVLCGRATSCPPMPSSSSSALLPKTPLHSHRARLSRRFQRPPPRGPPSPVRTRSRTRTRRSHRRSRRRRRGQGSEVRFRAGTSEGPRPRRPKLSPRPPPGQARVRARRQARAVRSRWGGAGTAGRCRRRWRRLGRCCRRRRLPGAIGWRVGGAWRGSAPSPKIGPQFPPPKYAHTRLRAHPFPAPHTGSEVAATWISEQGPGKALPPVQGSAHVRPGPAGPG